MSFTTGSIMALWEFSATELWYCRWLTKGHIMVESRLENQDSREVLRALGVAEVLGTGGEVELGRSSVWRMGRR